MGKKYERYHDALPLRNKVARLIWNVVYVLLFRPFCGRWLNPWRVLLLRCFGAKIRGWPCTVDATARIWAPWNLDLGAFVAIGQEVELYSVNKIKVGDKVAISEKAYICTASHDIRDVLRPLTHRPIEVENYAWVCARAIVLPGVTVHEGSVVGAGAVVSKDVPPWTVVAGNPAREVKKRELKKEI